MILFLGLLLLPASIVSASSSWIEPVQEAKTSYIYAPGVLGSEILISRYCPTFVASTGEIVTCSKGIEVIKAPATSCNPTEISLMYTSKKALKEERKIKKKSRTRRRSFISLLLTPLRAFWYTTSHISRAIFGFKVKKPCNKHFHSIRSVRTYWADPTKVNLAQEKDLELFKKRYAEHMESLAPSQEMQKIVLYGSSRGSALVFNFAALYHPQNVCGIVCEGLFDSLEHVAIATKSRRTRLLIKLLPKVTDFKHEGIVPIKVVDTMPLDMPILLITSYKDNTVPYECTWAIYTALRERGHTKVHILILKKSGHLWYPYCTKYERELYRNVVHAFYKQYGLAYIPEYAQTGNDYFTTMTQPDWKVSAAAVADQDVNTVPKKATKKRACLPA